MKENPEITAIVNETVEVLRSGGVILYPTDTVWGLGCDATSPKAVKKLCQLKERDPHKAMLVLIGSDAQLPSYVEEVPSIAYDLIDCAIRPLTIIYPRAKNLPPEVCASDGSIGIRITQEAFSQALCRKMRVPIVSTSANLSGEPTPGTFAEISEEVKARVDYIVPILQNSQKEQTPSEIIKLGNSGEVTVIRGIDDKK